MFKRKPASRMAHATAVRDLFHGIAIEAGDGCCAAARALDGERFLSDDVPLVPLEGCDRREVCRCRYRHYADRRTELRREADIGLPIRLQPGERRDGRGRRITDR